MHVILLAAYRVMLLLIVKEMLTAIPIPFQLNSNTGNITILDECESLQRVTKDLKGLRCKCHENICISTLEHR